MARYATDPVSIATIIWSVFLALRASRRGNVDSSAPPLLSYPRRIIDIAGRVIYKAQPANSPPAGRPGIVPGRIHCDIEARDKLKVLATLTSLLLSTGMLLLGHGMQLTLLPLRAAANGMPAYLIGISASCYFAGFALGCIAIHLIIVRVGHIRSFAVLAAVMISVILCLDLFDYWALWLLLRFMTGVAVSGLYTVIESWLNSQATPESRGRILATYTFITLLALGGGQALINVGPVESSTPFSLAALFMALAIVPVGMTRRLAPTPLASTRIRFRLLYQRSHSAFAGGILSGLVTGSFWALGAVFASNFRQSPADISMFMIAAIMGGAIFQYPIGWLSDRVDRRRVLLYLCLGLLVTASAVALSVEQPWFMLAVLGFGATALPLYSVALATAADVANEDEFVAMGTSVLLLNALGGAVAPLALGPLMTALGAPSLFWSFAVLGGLFAALLYRLTRTPRAVSVAAQMPFTAAAPDVAPTSFDLDPRGTEPASGAASGDGEPDASGGGK
jgi:MFS family permease